MNTRHYRISRLLTNLEAGFDADEQRLRAAELDAARAARTAQGIAAIEPAELAAQFAECPHRAWGQLATLSERQLIVEAIDYATWLAEHGIEKRWGAILECWTRKLSDRAAEAEALLALAEAGAFDRELLADDAGREADAYEPERPDAPTVEVPSETRPGVWYDVAIDGSSCTCPGFEHRGYCKHARAAAEDYARAEDEAMKRWARYGRTAGVAA